MDGDVELSVEARGKDRAAAIAAADGIAQTYFGDTPYHRVWFKASAQTEHQMGRVDPRIVAFIVTAGYATGLSRQQVTGR